MDVNKRLRSYGPKTINISSIPPPPLTPAPHRSSSSSHKIEHSVMNQWLSDTNCDIGYLKSTILATNKIISRKDEKIKRLKAEVSYFEAKSVDLDLQFAKEKAVREEQMGTLVQLRMSISDLQKNQEAQQSEIVSLEAEVNRLRAECASLRANQSVALDHSVDEISTKKRKKVNHECTNCGFSTFRANAMKTHQQEGCRSAVKTKNFTCDVCKAEFTYNTLRYHLNQYTKQSSHAKNGHQKHSPAHHRQMLQKLKQI